MFPHDKKFKDLIKQLSHPEADALIELFTYGKREEIRLIRSAFSMSEHVLKADITQFSSQMVGRLMSHRQHPMIEQFIQKLLAAQMPGIYPRYNETQWHALDQAGGAVLLTYTKLIPPLAYSPDGSLIVSKASDNVFKIFDAETEQELLTLSDSESRFQAVIYHPDGTQIAGISDQTLTVWDAKTGEVRFTVTNHTRWINSVAYSPLGHRIATASNDGTIHVYKTDTGEIFKILKGHEAQVRDVVYSPDNRYIASASVDKTIRIWHARTGKPLKTLIGHTSRVVSLDYSPTGRYLVSGSWDRTVKIWDTQTGQLIHTFTGHTHKVTTVLYHPNGWNVMSASGDGTIRVWDVETRQIIRNLTQYSDEALLLALRPDGRRIISKTTSRRPTSLMVEPRQDTPINHVHTPYVTIAYSPDGRQLISGSYHNPIIVWDAKTGLEQKRIGNNDFFVSKLLYSPDQKHIMSIVTGGIIVWDSTTHTQIFRIKIDFMWFNDAVYSSDGRFIVSVDKNGLIQCWDANSGQAITALTEKTNQEDYGEKLSNHPHQPLVAHARRDRTIAVWDLERGIIIKTWQANTQTNLGQTHKAVTFSPDGAYIATISHSEKGVNLWDANGVYFRRVLAGNTGNLWDACFSPDGQYIATAGDGLQIWEVSTGKCLQTFYTDSSLHCCAWSPTEHNVIAAGSNDGQVMFLEWRR